VVAFEKDLIASTHADDLAAEAVYAGGVSPKEEEN